MFESAMLAVLAFLACCIGIAFAVAIVTAWVVTRVQNARQGRAA